MRKFVTEKIVKFKVYTIIAEKIIVKFLYVKKKTQNKFKSFSPYAIFS